ncbi:MAG: hypothetical protein IJ796_09615 [Lachnospiraceae bacterium]|nr:hypothetical protein [Lachnospiraceae bacterium]
MRNTKKDVILHFIIGAIVVCLSVFLFLVKFNFKDLNRFVTFGGHFSVLGLVAAIVGGVFLVLAIFGTSVYSIEKKNDGRR